jgi:hypothetical protein
MSAGLWDSGEEGDRDGENDGRSLAGWTGSKISILVLRRVPSTRAVGDSRSSKLNNPTPERHLAMTELSN